MNTATSLIFFEDRQVSNFYPLSVSHQIAELRCGMFSLAEKWCLRFAATDSHYLTRRALRVYSQENSGRACNLENLRSPVVILINPRFLPDDKVIALLQEDDEPLLLSTGEDIVAVRLKSGSTQLKRLAAALQADDPESPFAEIEAFGAQLPTTAVDLQPFSYLWDLVHQNGAQIIADFEYLQRTRKIRPQAVPDPNCEIYAWDNVFVSPGARIDGQVVLDGRDGPIHIGPDVVIVAQTRVEGPAAIGAQTQLVGGRIRSGCSFGLQCRVGGEVEESIFHSFSNKYHDGFIGHAYLGEWVNLGALTTNSDLKNNYGTIKVELPTGLLNTGQTKVGCFLGDHVKTGIGTLLTTGMVVGFATNIFGGGLSGQRFLPGFLWGGATGFAEYELAKAIATAEVVMPRRGHELSAAGRELFSHIFAAEAESRAAFVK
ncbi:MAG: putative sugar nucleotidyl transferase [bacterium]